MNEYEWAEFERDFAIAVEMMGQRLAGRRPSYEKAAEAVEQERRLDMDEQIPAARLPERMIG